MPGGTLHPGTKISTDAQPPLAADAEDADMDDEDGGDHDDTDKTTAVAASVPHALGVKNMSPDKNNRPDAADGADAAPAPSDEVKGADRNGKDAKHVKAAHAAANDSVEAADDDVVMADDDDAKKDEALAGEMRRAGLGEMYAWLNVAPIRDVRTFLAGEDEALSRKHLERLDKHLKAHPKADWRQLILNSNPATGTVLFTGSKKSGDGKKLRHAVMRALLDGDIADPNTPRLAKLCNKAAAETARYEKRRAKEAFEAAQRAGVVVVGPHGEPHVERAKKKRKRVASSPAHENSSGSTEEDAGGEAPTAKRARRTSGTASDSGKPDASLLLPIGRASADESKAPPAANGTLQADNNRAPLLHPAGAMSPDASDDDGADLVGAATRLATQLEHLVTVIGPMISCDPPSPAAPAAQLAWATLESAAAKLWSLKVKKEEDQVAGAAMLHFALPAATVRQQAQVLLAARESLPARPALPALGRGIYTVCADAAAHKQRREAKHVGVDSSSSSSSNSTAPTPLVITCAEARHRWMCSDRLVLDVMARELRGEPLELPDEIVKALYVGKVSDTDKRIALRGGRCIRAGRRLPTDQVLSPYTGFLATDKDVQSESALADDRLARYRFDLGPLGKGGGNWDVYGHVVAEPDKYPDLASNETLLRRGNWTALINDPAIDPLAPADDDNDGNLVAEPNVKPVVLRCAGVPYIWFVTTRAIEKDEELVFKYGPAKYWARLHEQQPTVDRERQLTRGVETAEALAKSLAGVLPTVPMDVS